VAHRASMIASSPAVPKHMHVVSAPETDTAFPAVHDGHPSSPFTVQHPFALGVEPSLQTYALAESIRDDAHAMSAKHRKRKGVFINAPPLELLVVLANISVSSRFFCGLIDKSSFKLLARYYFYPFLSLWREGHGKRNILEENKTEHRNYNNDITNATARSLSSARVPYYIYCIINVLRLKRLRNVRCAGTDPPRRRFAGGTAGQTVSPSRRRVRRSFAP